MFGNSNELLTLIWFALMSSGYSIGLADFAYLYDCSYLSPPATTPNLLKTVILGSTHGTCKFAIFAFVFGKPLLSSPLLGKEASRLLLQLHLSQKKGGHAHLHKHDKCLKTPLSQRCLLESSCDSRIGKTASFTGDHLMRCDEDQHLNVKRS